MSGPPLKTVFYKRSTFVTHLPVDYLYTPAHAWMSRMPEGVVRVGLTKFAVRMLGETVDVGLEIGAGEPVQPGKIVGWVEGFKAISDLYCPAAGLFLGMNPALAKKSALVHESNYTEGWLYEVQGEPGEKSLDVMAYRALLDSTIDRILAQQKHSDPSA